MSEITSLMGGVQTITSNTGGAVSPDDAGNLNILGISPIIVTGHPLLHEIEISGSSAIATSFPTDSGTATPAFGALTEAGGTNINTSGSGSTVTINLDTALTAIDSITMSNNGSIRSGTTAGDKLYLKAYDNTGATYSTFATLTSGLTPTFDLNTATTINSSYIYRAGGTDVAVADGGTGLSSITNHGIMVGQGASSPTTKVLTDGQVLIGSTGLDPVAASLTAGSGITITPGAGSISIATTGNVLAYSNVATTPYTVAVLEEYLSVDTSSLSITIKLPDAATSGRVYIIKDRTGACTTRNITVTTVTGAVLIDGATTYVMNTNYQAIQVIGNGTAYEIF